MKSVGTAGRNRLWLFFCIYFLFWMAFNTLEPYLGVFHESRGLTGTQIGMATSIFSIATVIAALISGVIEDRMGRPGTVVGLLMVGMLMSTGALYLSHRAALTFAAVFFYGFCFSPVNGIVDKVLLDELQDQPERFSLFRTGGTAGAGAGVILAGLLYNGESFFGTFSAFWLLAALCALCARSMPQEHLSRTQIPRVQDYLDLVRNPYFIPIYLTMALWGFTESSVLQFLALYITGQGYSARLTSVFVAAAMVGEFLGFLIVPRLLKRMDLRRLLSAAFLLEFLRVGGLALMGRLPLALVVFVQFLGGGCYAILYSVITQVINRIYPAQVSYSAHSLKLVASRGVGMTCGSLMLGAFFDRGQITAGYWILTATAGILMIYYLLPIRKDRLI